MAAAAAARAKGILMKRRATSGWLGGLLGKLRGGSQALEQVQEEERTVKEKR